MNIFESIRSAISSVFSNKMRTFLTAIGIIIGVSSVIVITSLGKGFEKTISKTFELLNSRAVQIVPNYYASVSNLGTMNTTDIKNVKQNKNVKYVSGYSGTQVSITLKNPNEEKVYSLFASDPEFAEMQKNFFDIKYGRKFIEKENELKAKVIIIDEKMALNIFGRKDVIDEEVNVYINGKDYKFKVIGVTVSADNFFMTSSAIIPLNTYLDIYNTENFDMLYVELNSTENLTEVQREILRTIASNHNIEASNYMSISNMEQVNSITKVINLFTIFIGFVAGISLLVGGIGVMNIMLVTVTERTREIGIRKSLGATSGNIKFQFLIESMFLCCLGGVIGILFGYIGSIFWGTILRGFIESFAGIIPEPPVLSIPVAIGSMVVSTVVGVVFGVYPAGKAAKLDPIEALRYE